MIEPKDSFAIKMKYLTQLLYNQQRKLNQQIELDPNRFCNMIEREDPRLDGFFEKLVDAVIPTLRSNYNKNETKKSVVGFCYLLAGLRNKFANSLKLDIGLYLSACGTSTVGIDTLSNLGISVCYKTVENYKKRIANEHPKEIEKYFQDFVSK